ncbi:hypothetical protein A2115_00875 [Candidatus Woesebacteria bacterium GWA1_41_8]|uniref:FecR protein domain-containing protein n=1 Tax=Candidatus Woesebacteria bacterium GWA1_41_8 TaxID=1802471 RepID=A0A1F7WIA2_9BACT|nr:MAG: hypothetical protein A2115_00875 [Candidatus Woesebacteria bacterium GWA1_41_8]
MDPTAPLPGQGVSEPSVPQTPASSGLPPLPEAPVSPVSSFPVVSDPHVDMPPPPPPVSTPQPEAFTPPTVEVQSSEPQSAGDGENKKKVLVTGGVLVVLLVVIGGAIFFAPRISSRLAQKVQPEPEATSTPAPVVVASAKVSYLEGAAWSFSAHLKNPLYEGAEVFEGELVETGEDAKLVLEMDGGSILRLGPASRVTLTSLMAGDLKFSQEAGDVYVYVEKGTGRFTVAAGEVSVEALGTAFWVQKDEEVVVNVFESSVSVKEGEGEEIEVKENKSWNQGLLASVNLNKTAVSSDNFLLWALEEEIQRMEADIISQNTTPEDKKSKEAYIVALKEIAGDKKELLKQAFLKTTTGEVSEVTVAGQKTPEGAVSLSWTADGLAEEGYRIVWSTTPGKPYPGDKRTNEPLFGYEKILGPMKPGTSWYYRVCEWTGATCQAYSNELFFSF